MVAVDRCIEAREEVQIVKNTLSWYRGLSLLALVAKRFSGLAVAWVPLTMAGAVVTPKCDFLALLAKGLARVLS